MKMDSLDDLKKEYTRVTGKEPAIRWNRPTLQKKITDAEILAAGYAAKDGAMKKQSVEAGAPNPAFEELASQPEKLSAPAGPPDVEQSGDGRGGPREGAGRPTGQTDERARIERVMSLEVPDLAVAMGVDVLNGGLARITGSGLDDKPTSAISLKDFPHGSESMALGVTRLLYYWFPSLQGRTDVVTLHLEALFLIINPLRERAERIYKVKHEEQHPTGVQNGNESKTEKTVVSAGPEPSSVAEPVGKPRSKNASTRSKRLKR
jgi:hypothetical protein